MPSKERHQTATVPDAHIGKALTIPFLDTLMARQQDAIGNAKRAALDADAIGEPNPSTFVHQLVEDLDALKHEIGE